MTKKDYEVIAAAVATVVDSIGTLDTDAKWAQNEALTEFVSILSASLEADNPRFDADRFYTSCFEGE